MEDEYLAIILDDRQDDIYITKEYLRRQNILTVDFLSIDEGRLWIEKNLTSYTSKYSIVVIIDMKMPHRGYSRIEGSVLATWLTDAISKGDFPPTHIVAMTNDFTQQREWEGYTAGCKYVIPKPMNKEKAQLIYELLKCSPEINHFNNITMEEDAFREQQLVIMESLIYHSQTPVPPPPLPITGEDIRIILGLHTRAINLNPEQKEQAQNFVDKVGGLELILTRLKKGLYQLDSKEQQITLKKLLVGTYTKEQIARLVGMNRWAFDSHLKRLYEDIAIELSIGSM